MPTQTPTSRAVTGEVRAELARQGMTYGTLAQLTGLSIKQLGRRLNGETDFTVPEVGLVCDALGVAYSTLVARAEERAA